MTSKPLRIGISACFFYPDPSRRVFGPKTLLYAEQSMMRWVMDQGAMPFLIPESHPNFAVSDLLEQFDGLLLQGGSDLSPTSYGEEPLRPEWSGDLHRDLYEIALVHAAIAQDKPVLGICRGAQLLNVALGGSLYQDITTQLEGARLHRDAVMYDTLHHDLAIVPDTPLAEMYAHLSHHRVNSVHHQGLRTLGKDLRVEARCPEDDIIEAVRLVPAGHGSANPAPYAFAVQWHPEFQDPQDTALLDRRPILQEFFDAIQQRASR
ncbi:MAG: gamma-glutamyl-gamma-aminobutyrate hydrolase family protein [Myxococcales bacterium]|nr:gamma-glutamyl-gamma-aminobutyrate hydrolase family protein [Myxococcales bacterium]MCB9642767.1 gamma-glutamyl-gamma-aminobutyrate hydrolase family protein [Myxococcales bacterium]